MLHLFQFQLRQNKNDLPGRMTFQKIIIDLTGVTLTFLDRNV